MSSDPVERRLAAEFADLRTALETDGFAERLSARFSVRRRARAFGISAAGAAGAVFSASQFNAVARLFEPVAPLLAGATQGQEAAFAMAPQLLAGAAIAIAVAATSFVMQNEG